MGKSKKNAYWISGICYALWLILFLVGMSQIGSDHSGISTIITVGSWVFFVAAMLIMIAASSGWIFALGLAIFFVLLGLGVGSAFMKNPYLPTGFLLPFSVIFLVGWMVWFSIGAMAFRKNRLLKTGEKNSGVLKSYEQTGGSMKISGQMPKYQTTMIFTVKLYDGQLIESTALEMLSETEIYNLRAGDTYQLMTDKKKPEKAAVDWAETVIVAKSSKVINAFNTSSTEETIENFLQKASALNANISKETIEAFLQKGSTVNVTTTTETIENFMQKAPIIYHHKEEIMQKGLKGTAIVLQSTPFAGMKSPDGRFVFVLVMDVQIAGIPSYQTKGNYAVAQSKLPLTVPGSSLPIVADPDNHSIVIVDWDKT